MAVSRKFNNSITTVILEERGGRERKKIIGKEEKGRREGDHTHTHTHTHAHTHMHTHTYTQLGRKSEPGAAMRANS